MKRSRRCLRGGGGREPGNYSECKKTHGFTVHGPGSRRKNAAEYLLLDTQPLLHQCDGMTISVIDCPGKVAVTVLVVPPEPGSVMVTSGCATIAFRLALLYW